LHSTADDDRNDRSGELGVTSIEKEKIGKSSILRMASDRHGIQRIQLEGWFHIICKAMKEEEEKIFDETCQSLMADIWGCLQNSCEFGGSIASILSPYVYARVKQ
jgi:hypothetical protein